MRFLTKWLCLRENGKKKAIFCIVNWWVFLKMYSKILTSRTSFFWAIFRVFHGFCFLNKISFCAHNKRCKMSKKCKIEKFVVVDFSSSTIFVNLIFFGFFWILNQLLWVQNRMFFKKKSSKMQQRKTMINKTMFDSPVFFKIFLKTPVN